MYRRRTALVSDCASRRRFLAAGGSLLAALGLGQGLLSPALAGSGRLVVADPGGPFREAFGQAFYRPFERDTGIEIRDLARKHQPTSQVRAMVETGFHSWDVVTLTQADQVLLHDLGYLEELAWKEAETLKLMPGARTAVWMGTDVYATVLCYRSDRFSDGAPQSWADFWNVRDFPGRRALRRSPIDTLEIALLADGVAARDLYPIDIDRALAKLDELREHISLWWTGGAQTSQLLHSGEIDMLPSWNGRAQAVIDAGGPVAIQWNQGLYSIEGWSIPKGNPNVELGREFIRYCADPRRQAAYAALMAYGPTNPEAYDFLSSERARCLPTEPGNLEKLIVADQHWWGAHKDEAESRFNAWLLT